MDKIVSLFAKRYKLKDLNVIIQSLYSKMGPHRSREWDVTIDFELWILDFEDSMEYNDTSTKKQMTICIALTHQNQLIIFSLLIINHTRFNDQIVYLI